MHISAPRDLDFDAALDDDLDLPELAFFGVDGDDGLVAPMISDDPEHDRLVDPED